VFEGVALLDYLISQLNSLDGVSSVEVLSADGFGTRITIDELNNPPSSGLVLLADTVNGQPLTRNEGLVRLIVPGEKDDALRQVKWIAHLIVRE
jgi:DMSO/TMAO reductase YedYZ molybdopterin-dependent catalytic subunit